MKQKTWKRETAWALLLFLGWVIIGEQDAEMAKVLVWPTFTFAGLAFGLDWNSKQLRSDKSLEPFDRERP